jgi:hypothetical protein
LQAESVTGEPPLPERYNRSFLLSVQLQANRIEAVTFPALFFGTVVKNVAEMRTATLAEDFLIHFSPLRVRN